MPDIIYNIREAWLLEAGTCIRICGDGESREVEDEQ